MTEIEKNLTASCHMNEKTICSKTVFNPPLIMLHDRTQQLRVPNKNTRASDTMSI